MTTCLSWYPPWQCKSVRWASLTWNCICWKLRAWERENAAAKKLIDYFRSACVSYVNWHSQSCCGVHSKIPVSGSWFSIYTYYILFLVLIPTICKINIVFLIIPTICAPYLLVSADLFVFFVWNDCYSPLMVLWTTMIGHLQPLQ